MKKLTVKEIIKFGMKIEKESFRFYKGATKRLEDDETRLLTDELAKQEIDHLNRLKNLLHEESVNETLDADDTLVESIIKTSNIQKGASALDVLNVALDREINTKENYERFLALSPMDVQIAKTFKELKEMEEKHIEIINERINRLKKSN
jgi:rubrerythrin